MNERDEMDDAQLDRLLDEARWPASDEERLARLRTHWFGLRRAARRKMQWAAAGVCVAASLLIGAVTLFWSGRSPRDVARIPQASPATDLVSSAPSRAIRGEEPTTYERVVFLAKEAKTRPRPKKGTPASAFAPRARIASDSPAPPPPLVESQPPKSPPAPQLSPSEERSRHLADLLTRGTPDSLTEYLGYLRDPQTRELALTVAGGIANAPLDVWIASLDDPRPRLRLEAALVLGRMPNPEIVRRIGPSLLNRLGRQEATMALLLNPTPQSAAFVKDARRNIYLAATVSAAERQLATMSTFDGAYSP